MLERLIVATIGLASSISGFCEESRVIELLVDRAEEIVVLKIEKSEIGSVLNQNATTFRITGSVQESLHGALKEGETVIIEVFNYRPNRDFSPVVVDSGESYVAFLSPKLSVDRTPTGRFRIQDEPFGISPLTRTLLLETKRLVERKTNKASHSSPDRTESK